MELGGKNGIVGPGRRGPRSGRGCIVWSAFGTTCQRCTAGSRVIVDRKVATPLLERLERRAKALRLGDGLEPTTEVGPLINSGAREEGRELHPCRPS